MARYYLGQLQWTAPAQLLCLCDEIWVFEIKNGPTHQKWEQSFGYRQELGCSQVITCIAGSGVISFHYNVDEKRKLILGQDRCVRRVCTFCPRLRGFSLGLQFLPHPTDVHIRELASLNSPSLSGCGCTLRPGSWSHLCPELEEEALATRDPELK